jgi:hypothetical protein
MASSSAMNLLSIPQNPDFKIGDLKESIFEGAENVTKNFKLVAQYDAVNNNDLN